MPFPGPRVNPGFGVVLAPISHSWAEEDEVCSNWELRESFAGAVVLLIRFSLGRQFFLTPRLFRRTPYHRLT